MAPKIIVVTINWNGFKDTNELIESLRKVSYNNFEIIIVDNNSLSIEIDKLNSIIGDNIHLITLSENMGFAGGNNVGISAALERKADFILIINNDTIVESNFIEPLLEKFKLNSLVGIVAPQVNYYNDPKRIWSAGGKISRIRGSGFADSDQLETKIKLTDKLVDFVSGCCMLVRSEVFQNVGIFDENFFLYTEDADFCFRVKKAGYKIYVNPNSVIYHKVSKSTKNNLKLLPLYYTTRNRLYFSKKNFHKFHFITMGYISTTMLLKSLYWITTGNLRNISAIYRAFKDFLSGKMGETDHTYYLNN